MEDYFAILGIDRKFEIDLAQLRQKYLQQSRAFHPDFHLDKSAEELKEMEEKSALFNQAWTCLKDDLSRLEHLIELHGIEREKISLPQTFLMEMMDLNEQLEMEGETEVLKQEIESGKAEQYRRALMHARAYDTMADADERIQCLHQAAEALLGLKYFDRLSKQT
jgi:Fe-S protein assembly co-chaperone HscB